VSAFPYASYLAAKRTVDDRAINKDVFERLRRELAVDPREMVKVLELGAGLGTMVARLIDWRLAPRVDYTLLDVDAQLLEESRRWLVGWAAANGLRTESGADLLLIFNDGGLAWTVRFVHRELSDFLAHRTAPMEADLLIANAFLDLVDVPAVLPALLRLLSRRGLYWFSINFDGDTIFEPAHPLDDALLAVYHRSMDQRVRSGRPAGDSKTGRHLFHHLTASGARILRAGSSDWIVHAEDGRYPADEAHFLRHILQTVDEELAQHPEIDRAELAAWVAARSAQIDRGELVYIAHQLDLCGRVGG
jgi:hypothetical protein